MERFRPDRFTLLIAVIAALGAALVLRSHLAFGVGLPPDSAHYIAAARSLLAGEGVLRFDGTPLTSFPPLYSMLLAAASLGMFDPLAVAGPLGAAIFGLTAFVVGRYLGGRLESRLLAAWGCLATATAAPLMKESLRALSDPLFILLATAAIIQADRFLTEGGRRTLLWAAALGALAWQTRYIGVAVPAFVGLALLLQPGASAAQRAGRAATYATVAAVPMALWLLRNYLATGALTPHRPPADYPLLMMLEDVVEVPWSWAQTNAAAAAALLAPLVCLLVIVRPRRWTLAGWRPLWLFGGFALAYLFVFIAVISLLAGIYVGERGLHPRLLLPMYVPLLIAGVFALDRALSLERKRRLWGSALAAIVMVVLSLGAARQMAWSVSIVPPPGFNAPRWRGSETLRYVRESILAVKIYSNEPRALYLHRDGKSANRYFYMWWSRADREKWFAKHSPDDGDYVVWFPLRNETRDYGAADLRLLPGLKPVAVLADGVVFRIVR